jgi:hypothetical protein
VFTSAGYKLLRAEVLVWPKRVEVPGMSMMERIDGIYDEKADGNSLPDGSSTFSPSGYANETAMGEKFFVYKRPAVVASPARRRLATSHEWKMAGVAPAPIGVY